MVEHHNSPGGTVDPEEASRPGVQNQVVSQIIPLEAKMGNKLPQTNLSNKDTPEGASLPQEKNTASEANASEAAELPKAAQTDAAHPFASAASQQAMQMAAVDEADEGNEHFTQVAALAAEVSKEMPQAAVKTVDVPEGGVSLLENSAPPQPSPAQTVLPGASMRTIADAVLETLPGEADGGNKVASRDAGFAAEVSGALAQATVGTEQHPEESASQQVNVSPSQPSPTQLPETNAVQMFAQPESQPDASQEPQFAEPAVQTEGASRIASLAAEVSKEMPQALLSRLIFPDDDATSQGEAAPEEQPPADAAQADRAEAVQHVADAATQSPPTPQQQSGEAMPATTAAIQYPHDADQRPPAAEALPATSAAMPPAVGAEPAAQSAEAMPSTTTAAADPKLGPQDTEALPATAAATKSAPDLKLTGQSAAALPSAAASAANAKPGAQAAEAMPPTAGAAHPPWDPELEEHIETPYSASVKKLKRAMWAFADYLSLRKLRARQASPASL